MTEGINAIFFLIDSEVFTVSSSMESMIWLNYFQCICTVSEGRTDAPRRQILPSQFEYNATTTENALNNRVLKKLLM